MSSNLRYGSAAAATLLAFHQGKLECLTLALIVADKVSNIVAGVGVLSATYLRVNPFPHWAGHGNVLCGHYTPPNTLMTNIAKLVTTIQRHIQLFSEPLFVLRVGKQQRTVAGTVRPASSNYCVAIGKCGVG